MNACAGLERSRSMLDQNHHSKSMKPPSMQLNDAAVVSASLMPTVIELHRLLGTPPTPSGAHAWKLKS